MPTTAFKTPTTVLHKWQPSMSWMRGLWAKSFLKSPFLVFVCRRDYLQEFSNLYCLQFLKSYTQLLNEITFPLQIQYGKMQTLIMSKYFAIERWFFFSSEFILTTGSQFPLPLLFLIHAPISPLPHPNPHLLPFCREGQISHAYQQNKAYAVVVRLRTSSCIKVGQVISIYSNFKI